MSQCVCVFPHGDPYTPGGFLQAVMFGYPGIRVRADGLFLSPLLYENVGQVTLRGVAYLGNRLDFVYDAAVLLVDVQDSVPVS
jgi:hypothetical protein